MPNKEGGYGGYQRKPDRQRQVRAPGSSGGVRRVPPSGAAPSQTPRSRAGQSGSRSRQPARPAQQPPRQVYRAPYAPPTADEADGWQKPPAPPRRAAAQPRPTPAQQALRAAARRARQDRRLRRRLTLAGTAVCILLAAGVINAVLPADSAGATSETAQDPTAGLTASLVAPLPYAASQDGGITTIQDWGDVGPARQTDSYTYTAAPAQPAALPAFGRVDLDWFDDAAFLGDSLTVGFVDYEINVGDAQILGYEGASPNQIANRATMANGEVALDVLSGAQPAKLYLLMGANALAYQTGNDEGFLSYYGQMLDELKAALPNTAIYVQSVLPVRSDVAAEMPGLTPERVASINASLQTMAAEKGCYYLALTEALCDENGYLNTSYAEQDGLHLTVSGYNAWVDYLCTHVPYDKDNPYQIGSDYYLTDSMKTLLSDLP